MRELVRTNDPVRLSWLTALLAGEGIHTEILDLHTSVLEGSAGAIPRRLVVDDHDYEAARRTLIEADELDPEPDEAADALLDGRVRLHQPRRGYRVAIDAVLLAAATPECAGPVAELGAGVGAASLCYARRVPGARVVGAEIQPALVALARRNAAENGLADRVSFAEADIRELPSAFPPETFEHVMTNPPHMTAARGAPPADVSKALANFEGDVPLATWVASAFRLVRAKGSVTVIHRADRLDELLAEVGRWGGGIVIVPLWPGGDRPAKRVIVRARRGVRTPLTLSRGVDLHHPEGGYTQTALALLRDGAALRA